MPEIIRIGCMDHTMDGTLESANRVYDSDGICPTLPTMCGGGQQPKVLEVREITMPLNPQDDGTSRTIKSQYAKNSVQNLESTGSFGCSGAIRAKELTIPIRQATQKGYIELTVSEFGGGVCDLTYPTSQLRRGRVQGNGQISPTLTTESIPSVVEVNDEYWNFLYLVDGKIWNVAIRKLIPLECWRLMGFTDEDFHKAEAVNSNTQLYKQAGNSIVKDVLMAIFRSMNIQGIPKVSAWRDDAMNPPED